MVRKILLLLWLAFVLPCVASAQTAPSGQFLHLSDIHFNPFADQTLVPQLSGTPVDQWESILQKSPLQTPETDNGQDSNYALLKSALQAATAPSAPGMPPPDYDYIIYTGDYLSHGFMDHVGDYIKDPDPKKADAKQKAFAAQTVAFVNWMIQKYIPGTPLIATLGNNDSDCGDYQLKPGGDILPGVEASLPVVANDPAALADFQAGGYYRTPHPTVANTDMLVLSVFWSRKYKNYCNGTPADPAPTQMQWLDAKLADAKAKGRRAIILMHIPPGMDGFSFYGATRGRGPGQSLWTTDEKLLNQFLSLASQYKAQLVDGFAGHTHMDEFRVIADSAPIMAVRMGPSVTPSNGNRPAFTAFNYDTADGSATDYTVSSYDSSNGWTAYQSFTATYGFKRYNAANVQSLAGLILGDPGTRGQFSAAYATGNPTPAAGRNYRFFVCALTQLSAATYGPCLKAKTAKMRN